MLFVFPHRVNVWLPVMPWMNFLLILGNVIVYLLVHWTFAGDENAPAVVAATNRIDSMVLQDWTAAGIFGSTVLHFGFLHILFNMFYLLVFGNAVCAKLGNIKFFFLYFLGGGVASVAHLLFDGTPAIGASGAINAVIGCFFVLYPTNRVECYFWFFLIIRTFSISAGWLILFWFGLDLWGVYTDSNDAQIAFWAHIGGFVFGVLAGFIALALGWIEMTKSDHRTLIDLILGRKAVKVF